MGKILAVCISEQRGTQKINVHSARLIKDWGIENDAHAGKWHRQVSLLSSERIAEFRKKGAEITDGAFGENLIVEGIDFKNLAVGTLLRCGDILLEMTQIGKECHSHCEIYKVMGDCIMPREGVFARVLRGGIIREGDVMTVDPMYALNVSLEEGTELVLSEVMHMQTGTEDVPLGEAFVRAAAKDVFAGENIPPFDKSAYDGFAFKSEDTLSASEDHPARFKVMEEIPAGSWPTYRIESGCASKILTGAPIPEGADAVIAYEQTNIAGQILEVSRVCAPDSNIIHAGEDVHTGELVLGKGKTLCASDIAQLAGLGLPSVTVHKKLKVGILSTGSELVGINEPLEPGKIRNTNEYLLSCELLKAHMVPHSFGCVRDDAEAIAERMKSSLDSCDCLITTGGASVGDYDVMKEAVVLAGGRMLFWRLRMKPGAAAAAAMLNGKPVFILSGNSAAAAVTFHMLALPALRKMAGYKDIYPRRIQVKLLEDFSRPNPNRRFVRGRMIIKNGEAFFEAGNKQGNSMVSSMSGCELLAEIPAGMTHVDAGEILFAWDLEHLTTRRGMNI